MPFYSLDFVLWILFLVVIIKMNKDIKDHYFMNFGGDDFLLKSNAH